MPPEVAAAAAHTALDEKLVGAGGHRAAAHEELSEVIEGLERSAARRPPLTAMPSAGQQSHPAPALRSRAERLSDHLDPRRRHPRADAQCAAVAGPFPAHHARGYHHCHRQ